MSDCPIAFDRLVDAHAGELSEADEHALEEHAFACEVCGEAYARVGRLVAGLRSFIPPVISRERLARLVGGGTRVTLTPVAAGTRVAVRFSPDTDLLVHALQGNLADAERVDVRLDSLGGAPLIAFDDVAFDRDNGEVLIACQRHYDALGFPAEIRFRVQAHTADGVRAVGEYVVDHLFG
jgi:hypothetical protein